MSKYSRNRRVSKLGKRALVHRRWQENVGDGAKITREGRTNPNDANGRTTKINRHAAKPGCRGIEVVGE